ncbi:hypothetical protein DY023_06335 [Microbacterium bovistercoris]|uniref:Uncharacterized protein n=1 Tax=Microbacterium bovistercoris TaxID=2293570 RepID=A0A371NW58_9MICO|nr:hypothetical protein [Microbacterium bovistercoris]REJ06393.1 hypothetical protein DY023_06335 [Microbacterium bovistercoris]
MTKARTKDAHDHDIDSFIASVDPATMRDAARLRAIAEARDAKDAAEARLTSAVAAARAAGDSWTMIGLALRTSKQNAFRKYGAKAQ